MKVGKKLEFKEFIRETNKSYDEAKIIPESLMQEVLKWLELNNIKEFQVVKNHIDKTNNGWIYTYREVIEIIYSK